MVKMNKIYDIGMNIRTSDSVDDARRLYKNISEIGKKLDDLKYRALTVLDVFTPNAEALRSKLRNYCERLIISDPVNHAPKMEELLWRRGFYDLVSAAKSLRRGNNPWNDKEKALLSIHLSVGMGFYHHLISRLEIEFDLDMSGIVDFAYSNKKRSIYVEKSYGLSKTHSEEVKKCVTHFIHRSLICLGDLARYGLDLDPLWDSQIAIRYYKTAIVLDERYGMPHNQLGSIAGNKNYGLDAVYYYMRSLLCTEPFEGAEGNLKGTIIAYSSNSHEKCTIQSCMGRFFLLLQLWDHNLANTLKVNEESQTLLNEIETCLKVRKPENINHEAAQNEESIESYLAHYKTEETNYLSDDMIFKMIVICLMKIFDLETKYHSEIHGVVAFVLAVFSQLLQLVIMKLQESLSDISRTEGQEHDEANNTKKMDENKNSSDNNDNVQNTKDNISLDNGCKAVNNKNGEVEINHNNVNDMSRKRIMKARKLMRKLMRRRNRGYSSDSDASEGEEALVGSSSDDKNSDISENEEDDASDDNILSDEALSEDLSEDEMYFIKEKSKNEDNINGQTDVKDKFVEENENVNSPCDENNGASKTLTCVAQKEKQNLDPIKVLQVLDNEKLLISIKVCCDWLQGNQDIIKTCARGSNSLFKRLITLINLINLDSKELLKKWEQNLEVFSCSEKVEEVIDTVPLPEDVDLKGLPFFENAHKNIDWKIIRKKKITTSEETLLRVLKIVKFGHYLCSVQDSGFVFDSDKGLFTELNLDTLKATKNQIGNKNVDLQPSRTLLMKHMGKLWLKSEVHALESRVLNKMMSPYLVPDHEAVTKFLPLIKHLVYSKKFIIIIPSVVISVLDEMKKVSSQTREAIRWIESQLKAGSRFLRPQRVHETLEVPLLKGPKSKDKEAWFYFKIVECCHYFNQQWETGDTEIPVVTLITGFDEKKTFTFNPDGLTKSAGVNFENIGAFHAKWKVSIKSHG